MCAALHLAAMASSASSKPEDLDPAEFVANIRKLGEKKDAEDAERLAKLEQEIELGRRERAMSELFCFCGC